MPYYATFRGAKLLMLPGVFCPVWGEGSQLLADCLDVGPGERVLDLGTGSGALAILAGRRAMNVVATDCSARAVECAALNVKRFGLHDRIQVRFGHLFEPLGEDELFDLIVFNPPFMLGKPKCVLEAAMYDDSYATLRQFFAEVRRHLCLHGRVLIAFSTCGHMSHFRKLMETSGLSYTLKKRKTKERLRFFVFEGRIEF